jgi:hypothetical protein
MTNTSICLEGRLEYAEDVQGMFDRGEFFGTCFTCEELENLQEFSKGIVESFKNVA